MAELADAGDLKSPALGRPGSNPGSGIALAKRFSTAAGAALLQAVMSRNGPDMTTLAPVRPNAEVSRLAARVRRLSRSSLAPFATPPGANAAAVWAPAPG